jgi:hypothetical protein
VHYLPRFGLFFLNLRCYIPFPLPPWNSLCDFTIVNYSWFSFNIVALVFSPLCSTYTLSCPLDSRLMLSLGSAHQIHTNAYLLLFWIPVAGKNRNFNWDVCLFVLFMIHSRWIFCSDCHYPFQFISPPLTIFISVLSSSDQPNQVNSNLLDC